MEKWFQNKNFPAKKGKRGTNARKAHRDINARKVRRALGVLLAAALVFQTLPFGSAAASASEVRGGLCEHHRSHTPDCGYTEAKPGAECTHEHTEDCYKTVEDCIHGHTESCYPADTATDSEGAPADAGERQPAECGHSCSEESGCITKELDCRHEHDGSCGYQEETPGSPCTFVCEICNSGTPEDDGNASETGGEIKEPDQEPEEKPDDGQEECICEKPCKEGSDNESSHTNKDCPVCGAEDADLSECKGKGGEEDTQNPEDTGICKHHQAHDESCGYQPASENGEGSQCTYECRICPIEDLIAALPDVGSITDENAEEVRAQLEQILALFAELTGEEQEQLDLSRCYELQEALDGAKTPVPAEEILTDAVAEIVKSDGSTTYVDESDLDAAFRDNGNSGAAITLLANVERTNTLTIKANCTLDLNGHKIKSTNKTCLSVDGSFAVTIQGEGEIISEQSHALVCLGTVTLEGGTFTGNGGNFAGVYANTGATLSVTGENVVIQNTGGYGLAVNNAQSVQLSAGTYSGTAGAISIVGGSLTLGGLLAHSGDTRYAYFDESGAKPITGVLGNKSLTGTVTVKACDHSTVTAADNGNGTHSTPECPACGLAGVENQAHDWTETTPCTVCGAVAVAKVVNGSSTTYVGALADAFTEGNSGATVTLLSEVDLGSNYIEIRGSSTFTLDLNGQTVKAADYGAFNILGGSLTIQDSGTGGKIESSNITIEVNSGTLSIKSGTVSGFYGVRIISGTVNISGGAISGNDVGLFVDAGGNIALSGGTYNGKRTAIRVDGDASVSLKDMLATGYAYHQNDIPVAKAEGLVGDYEAGEVPLDATPAWLSGTVTVKECQHNGEGVCTYTHTSGTTTHQKTCLACGNKCDEENCSFGENGKCACEAVLAVALKDNTELTYNGTEQTPEVNVTVDGTALAADNYSVAYSNNINAGENTAKVTVSGKSFTGTVTKTFTIKKATLTTDGKGTAAGTYGAKLSELTVTGPTVKLNGTEVPGTWKLAGDTIPNAGNTETRNATFTPASGGENYNPLKAQVTLNIAKAPLTVTSVTIKTRPYKYAYYAAEVSGVSFTGLVNGDTLALGQDYAAAGSYDDPNAGENKSATILVVLKSSAKANNYTLPKDSSVNAIGTITAIPIADKNVTLSPASAVYDGTEQKPTVTIAGLTEGTDYTVSYIGDFTKAGEHTVTVTGKGNYEGTVTKTFTIEKAEQTDFAFAAVTKPYEKNGTFTLAAAGGAGSGAVLYRVPEKNGVLMVNGDMATIIGTGTVTVTVTKAESDNYKAAMATGTVTITKATAPAITYPTAGSITYGQKLSDSALTGGSTEYGTFAWENGSTIPAVDNTGYTVVFTASEETKKNYETIEDTTQNVSVKVEKAAPAVSVTAAVSGSKDNRQAVLTVNVAKAGAGAFPTGTVTFIDCTGGTEIGTATLTGGSATCTWEGLQDKEYTVRAVYAGNNNYTEAESRELTFDAAKQDQQGFALDEIEAKTYGDAAVPLKTTGGNGSGAVRYESSDENVIRIEDDRAVITGAGTATITAIKAGDDRYNEASAGRTVTVAKKALTVRADSITVVRGDTMPLFTYKAPELVNGDTFTADPAMTAGVQDTDTLGKYDIVISGGTLRNSESYNITYVNGILNIVECFYTVTVTDGTGSGEYAEGDTVTVTADERNGYTFTGWSSGDGVTFADSKAKTTTFAMPAKAVAVKANYTRNSSGGNTGGGGGNSGGNENNGGTGGGDSGNGNNGGNGSTNPGNGNTTPQPSVTQPTDTNANPGNETAPGTGTTPVNPGTGNTVRPGTTPGSGSAGTPAQGTKQPFIKGADGKIGWDVIRAEEEQAQEGSTINVDMNGSVVVPGDIFDSIKGKDITITFDMGNGILWSVDGKSITADRAGDIDFSVKTGVNTVPVDIVNNVIGENYSIQISLAYEGEFGFTAVLSINLGKENAGYTASLYYYNESTGELEFICKDQIAEDGTVSLVFTHASDYVIAVDIESMDGKEGVDNTPKMSRTGDDSIIADVKENDEVAWIYKLVIIAVGTIVIVAGFGIIFIWKKKKEEQ